MNALKEKLSKKDYEQMLLLKSFDSQLNPEKTDKFLDEIIAEGNQKI